MLEWCLNWFFNLGNVCVSIVNMSSISFAKCKFEHLILNNMQNFAVPFLHIILRKKKLLFNI